ncbi:MAG: hypothetical protein HY900_19255 [Deltaproteobacteria bacterium]|nr:hypothetical protein [Deltaproteobacteria bacterium]
MTTTHDSTTFSIDDEYSHSIGPDALWQESVVITWFDLKAGIGGFHRIGHEPHAKGGEGMATSWLFVTTLEGTRFRRHDNLPLKPGDRARDLFSVSGRHELRFDGRATWTINDESCRLRLIAEDYTPRFDLFRRGGTVTDDFAPGHLEAAGTVKGEVVIDGRLYEVDGLCYRDHSWGKRDWTTLLTHRWIAGTCGPQLTFNAASWHGVDGSLRSFGIVVRNGKVAYASKVDIVVYQECDGTTHRGGRLSLSLPDGQRIAIEPQVVDGSVTLHNGVACVDELCTFEYEGAKGFCDFEISTNPRGGSGPVSALVRATMEDGFSRRK